MKAAVQDEEHRESVKLTLPASLDFELVVVRLAGCLASQWGMSRSRAEDVKTVAGEAFLNAVEHGSRGREEERVRLEFSRCEAGLCLEVFDSGRGFNPAGVPEPVLELKIKGDQSGRGWGLFLIGNLVNQLEVYPLTPKDHCLKMTMGMIPSGQEQ